MFDLYPAFHLSLSSYQIHHNLSFQHIVGMDNHTFNKKLPKYKRYIIAADSLKNHVNISWVRYRKFCYISLVRPHLEFDNVVMSSNHIKNRKIRKNIGAKLISEFRNISYEETLREIRLPSLYDHRARGDRIEV